MRVWVWIVPVIAWAVCNTKLVALVTTIGLERESVRLIIGAQVVAALAMLAVFAIARRGTPAVYAVALTAGALVAIPVPVEYSSDGCNDTTGFSYAVTAPYIELVEPEHTRVVFNGVQTLMLCVVPRT